MGMPFKHEQRKKSYVRVPAFVGLTRSEKMTRAVVGSVMSPTYWLLAHRYGVPGLRFRVDSARLGMRLAYFGNQAIPTRKSVT